MRRLRRAILDARAGIAGALTAQVALWFARAQPAWYCASMFALVVAVLVLICLACRWRHPL